MSLLIDAKGKNCPIPVVLAKKEMDGGSSNFIVEVDNVIAVENLKRLGNSQGFVIEVDEKDGSFFVAFARDHEHCKELLMAMKGKVDFGDYCVFVGKEWIGEGDELLGKSLMQMFFYTLSQGDNLPRSILFMNGGVKLPALDSQIVSHLMDLVEKGVLVLVCGACLNHYELLDQLKVGIVSNMYDITEQMHGASKVITL